VCSARAGRIAERQRVERPYGGVSDRRELSSIELRGLTKSFGELMVLGGVDLMIGEGRTVAIIGESGCGKSVLLKIIIGLLKPNSGSVLFDGLDITRIKYKELVEIRKRFGMVFQGSALFDSLTVEENVGLGLRRHTKLSEEEVRKRIGWCLDHVGLKGVDDKFPAELSGGMKKRVAFARAIAMNPQFLLYDEPTTGLDPVTARRINQLIGYLNQKLSVTSIIVTHDIATVSRVADRMAMLHQGVIRFEGTPEEMMKTEDPVVRQFVTAQGMERV
jgi:phospholipid/cholesterol/gamma-HCH transport system ATP-binding protein